MLQSYLLATEATKKQIDTVALISLIVVAVVVLAFTLVALFWKNEKSTKAIVFGAICTALSFVLSFLKIAPVTYGGSITLFSMVPLIIYAYFFGPVYGLVTGVVYGLLQFIQAPYILVPVTFLLDYILAFACFFVAGFFGIAVKKGKMGELSGVLCACGFTYLWRFLMHFVSGFVYFKMGAIWVNLPTPNAFVYSLLYQLVYLGPDFVLAFVALLLLEKKNVLSRLRVLAKQELLSSAAAE